MSGNYPDKLLLYASTHYAVEVTLKEQKRRTWAGTDVGGRGCVYTDYPSRGDGGLIVTDIRPLIQSSLSKHIVTQIVL